MNKRILALFAFLSILGLATTAAAVSLPNAPAVFETSLASRITSTDTSMTLVSNSAGGETVNGYDCFTIDEGLSTAEYVCGTVSGTSVTGLERGLSYANGTTTSTSRAFAHRVGADVKKTDFPLIQRLRNVINGVEGLPNPIGYLMQHAQIMKENAVRKARIDAATAMATAPEDAPTTTPAPTPTPSPVAPNPTAVMSQAAAQQ